MGIYLISSDGRRHLLEFLRNLTPQVLLLSTAIILYALWQKSSGNHHLLAFSIGTGIICLLAACANAENFLDNAFSEAAAIAAERDRLKEHEPGRRARLAQVVRYIWRYKRVTFFELLISAVVLYAALYSVFIAALFTAIRAVA
jgi:hypothetical protein